MSANLYATKMAERSSVTYPSTYLLGSSEGEVCNAVLPELAYARKGSRLFTRSFVEREHIGVMICGSGLAISAAKARSSSEGPQP